MNDWGPQSRCGAQIKGARSGNRDWGFGHPYVFISLSSRSSRLEILFTHLYLIFVRAHPPPEWRKLLPPATGSWRRPWDAEKTAQGERENKLPVLLLSSAPR